MKSKEDEVKELKDEISKLEAKLDALADEKYYGITIKDLYVEERLDDLKERLEDLEEAED